MVRGMSQKKGPASLVLQGISLVVLAGVLAVSLSGNPGVTGPLPSLTLLAGGAAAVVAALLVWVHGWNCLSRVSIWVALLLVTALISQTASLSVFLSQTGLAAVVGFAGVFLQSHLVSRDLASWRRVGSAMLGIASLSIVHALVIGFEGEGPLKGTFTNPDCYSVVCLIQIFLGLSLALEGHHRLWRWFFAGATFLGLLALILTGSRSGFLGLMAGYALFLFTLASSRSSDWRALAVKLFVIPAVLSLGLVAAGGSLHLGSKWIQLVSGRDQASYKTRFDVLRFGYKTVLRSPWVGSGLGCFHLAYQQDRPPMIAAEDYMNIAHNDYMQWAVEAGVPGGICWMGLVGFSLLGAWRSYQAPTSWVAGILGCELAVAVFMVFNPSSPIPGLLFWMGAVWGLGASLAQVKRPPEVQSWQPRVFPAVLVFAALGFWSLQFSWQCFKAQRLCERAVQLERVLDWEGAVLLRQAAQSCTPDDSGGHISLAGLSRRAFVFTGKETWLELEEAELRRAVAVSPRNLQALILLAKALEDRGRVEEAYDFAFRASEYAPYSPIVRRALARNLIFSGKPKEAADCLATIESTGLTIDDAALAELIFWFENQKPGEGIGYLKKLARNRALEVGLKASERALSSREFAEANRILMELERLVPGDPQVALTRANCLGLAGNHLAELKVLEKLRRNPATEADEELLEKVWRKWSELRLKDGENLLVLSQLEDYLISHPRQEWARLVLAKIHLSEGRKAEARSALREGIPYDSDGGLRIQLGDLCRTQGLNDLARSYYREALGLSKDRAGLEARLKSLSGESDDVESLSEGAPSSTESGDSPEATPGLEH